MFESVKIKSAAGRLAEENLYELVLEELSRGGRRSGIWARALADSEGNEDKAHALYIKYRVQSMMDEYTIAKDRDAKGNSTEAKKAEASGTSAWQEAEGGIAIAQTLSWAIVIIIVIAMLLSIF